MATTEVIGPDRPQPYPGSAAQPRKDRSVLMIAFHYPPCFGSSGLHRTLNFSRYLPGLGWRPVVLTVHPRAHELTTEGGTAIPPHVDVVRSFAVDAARHLAIGGAHLGLTALPDRWGSWWLGAVPTGLRQIRRQRPRLIWSTYPIATAHLIGLTLHRLTSIPWIADFRDPMTEDDYPSHPRTRRVYRWIERQTMARATRVVFTASSTRRMYLDRYPRLRPEHCLLIPNGYAEEDFASITPDDLATRGPHRQLRLVHSGTIYPHERDPRPFLRALARLKREARVTGRHLRVDLRASASERTCAPLISELDLADMVSLLPALPYQESLQDCAAADGLLLIQGPSCDGQIPAKAYEYLRLRRPLLALTSPGGDTAALLQGTGGSTIVDGTNEDAIYAALPAFLDKLRRGHHGLPDPAQTGRYARHHQAAELGRCFGALIDGRQ